MSQQSTWLRPEVGGCRVRKPENRPRLWIRNRWHSDGVAVVVVVVVVVVVGLPRPYVTWDWLLSGILTQRTCHLPSSLARGCSSSVDLPSRGLFLRCQLMRLSFLRGWQWFTIEPVVIKAMGSCLSRTWSVDIWSSFLWSKILLSTCSPEMNSLVIIF